MELELTRHWWVLALRGVAAILFGVLAFIWPGITLTVLVLLWGVYALADGMFTIALAIAGPGRAGRWWALLVEGLAGIAAGVLTFLWPGLTMLALLYVIAAWAVVTGIFEVIAAIRLRNYIQGEWLLAVIGVLSVLFGLGLFVFPIEGLLVLILWIGAYAVAFGVLLLVLGFQLRGLARGGVPRGSAF